MPWPALWASQSAWRWLRGASAAQIHGTRNKRNITKALILALEGQQMPEDVHAAALDRARAAEDASAARAAREEVPELVARSGRLMISDTLGRSAARATA